MRRRRRPDPPADVRALHDTLSAPAVARARASASSPALVEELVQLGQVQEAMRMVDAGGGVKVGTVYCPRLDADLVARSCVKRWRIANGRVRGSGHAAIAKAQLEACRRCPVGEARASIDAPHVLTELAYREATKPKE